MKRPLLAPIVLAVAGCLDIDSHFGAGSTASADLALGAGPDLFGVRPVTVGATLHNLFTDTNPVVGARVCMALGGIGPGQCMNTDGFGKVSFGSVAAGSLQGLSATALAYPGYHFSLVTPLASRDYAFGVASNAAMHLIGLRLGAPPDPTKGTLTFYVGDAGDAHLAGATATLLSEPGLKAFYADDSGSGVAPNASVTQRSGYGGFWNVAPTDDAEVVFSAPGRACAARAAWPSHGTDTVRVKVVAGEVSHVLMSCQ